MSHRQWKQREVVREIVQIGIAEKHNWATCKVFKKFNGVHSFINLKVMQNLELRNDAVKSLTLGNIIRNEGIALKMKAFLSTNFTQKLVINCFPKH